MLELGLAPQHCKLELFKAHVHVPKLLYTALRDLDSAIDSHRLRRHRYVHRGRSPNIGEVISPTDPSFMELLVAVGQLDETDPDLAAKAAATWHHFLPIGKPAMSRASRDAQKAVVRVLTALLPHWQERLPPHIQR